MYNKMQQGGTTNGYSNNQKQIDRILRNVQTNEVKEGSLQPGYYTKVFYKDGSIDYIKPENEDLFYKMPNYIEYQRNKSKKTDFIVEENPLVKAQQGGQYAENELAFLSEIAIKDDMGQYNHPNKITEINSPNITMKGVDYPLLGISKETGETKYMFPNRDYYFGKETKKVIEIPIKK